ncbi:hypothetical protein WA158_007723 [Blastocystis sp. Blastoise]
MSTYLNAKNPSDLINFPPLYSVQSSEKVEEDQFRVWTDLLLNYGKLKKEYTLTITSPIWTNSKIDKEVPHDLRIKIMDYVVAHKQAIWVDQKVKNEMILWWRPLNEWVDVAYQDLKQHMTSASQLFTYQNILDGDEFEDSTLHGMNIKMLDTIMTQLVFQGKLKKQGNGRDAYIKISL